MDVFKSMLNLNFCVGQSKYLTLHPKAYAFLKKKYYVRQFFPRVGHCAHYPVQ